MAEVCIGTGWGSGLGMTPWGGEEGSELRLLLAAPIRENVVRIEFNHPVRFTGLLDPKDGSGVEHYEVVEVDGTGLDGKPIHPVNVVGAELASVDGAGGRIIDVTLDRPLSHFPCRYNVVVNNLFSTDGFPLELCFTTVGIYGVQQTYQQPKLDNVAVSKDFANPQTLASTLDPLSNPFDPDLLGSIPVDEQGDYAFDEGIPSLKKRIYRRLITRKGAFVDKPDYGVGVMEVGKRLANRSTLEQLVAEAQKQIGQEPDVQSVKVKYQLDSDVGMVRFIVLVRTVAGQAAKFEAPFTIAF
jgi:hypothetical protein